MELFEGHSREKMLISKIDANRNVEGNGAFITEWLMHECLRDVKARVYKDCNARENALRTLEELFGIIWNYSI